MFLSFGLCVSLLYVYLYSLCVSTGVSAELIKMKSLFFLQQKLNLLGPSCPCYKVPAAFHQGCFSGFHMNSALQTHEHQRSPVAHLAQAAGPAFPVPMTKADLSRLCLKGD